MNRSINQKLPAKAWAGKLALIAASVPICSCSQGAVVKSTFIDFRPWELQLPVGTPGHPQTIPSTVLQTLGGFADSNRRYFYKAPDGSTVMAVPGSPAANGCVTTTNSLHCRTELREVDETSGKPTSWDPAAGRNRLRVTLAASNVDQSQYGTVIGQIHFDDAVSNKPLCELYLNAQGTLTMGVEQSLQGGKENFFVVGSVHPGAVFSYEIRYEKTAAGVELQASIDSKPVQAIPLGSLPLAAGYFKVGNYNQSAGQNSSPSELHFLSIHLEHQALEGLY